MIEEVSVGYWDGFAAGWLHLGDLVWVGGLARIIVWCCGWVGQARVWEWVKREVGWGWFLCMMIENGFGRHSSTVVEYHDFPLK